MAIRKSNEETFLLARSPEQVIEVCESALSKNGFTRVVVNPKLRQLEAKFRKLTVWGEILITCSPWTTRRSSRRRRRMLIIFGPCSVVRLKRLSAHSRPVSSARRRSGPRAGKRRAERSDGAPCSQMAGTPVLPRSQSPHRRAPGAAAFFEPDLRSWKPEPPRGRAFSWARRLDPTSSAVLRGGH
jgi:hypothetical protein